MKLLHIDASALGQHSVSRGLTAAIVTELKRQHAGLEISYRDLAAAPLCSSPRTGSYARCMRR